MISPSLIIPQKSGLGFPDWANKVEISTFPYTASDKGFLFGTFKGVSSNAGTLWVNGTIVFNEGDATSRQTLFIPIDKTDIVSKTGTLNGVVYFITFK